MQCLLKSDSQSAILEEVVVVKDSRRLFTKRQARNKLAQCGGRCERCNEPLQNGFHMHHVIPHSKGGMTTLSNCMAVCGRCHKEIHDGN